MGRRGRPRKVPPPTPKTMREISVQTDFEEEERWIERGSRVSDDTPVKEVIEKSDTGSKGSEEGSVPATANSDIVTAVTKKLSWDEEVEAELRSVNPSPVVLLTPAPTSTNTNKERLELKETVKRKPEETVRADGGTKPKISYASVVKGNRDSTQGWSLHYTKPAGEDGVVKLTPMDWSYGMRQWEDVLIGYIPGIKPTFNAMTGYVKNVWKGLEVPKVIQLRPGVFMFKFLSREQRQQVLNRRWFFWGNPIILKEWTPAFNPDNLDTSNVQVWIQLPDLPYSLWNDVAIGKIASFLGEPLATDKLTAGRDRLVYARVLVEMRVRDKLHEFIPVEMPHGIYKQKVVYEWKPTYCKNCLKLGHEEKTCGKRMMVWKEVANHNPKGLGEAGQEKAKEADAGQGGKTGTEESTQLERPASTRGVVIRVQQVEGAEQREQAGSDKQEMQNAGGGNSHPVIPND